MKNNKSWTEGQTKIYEMVTNSIIVQLEKGEIPWKKPWTCGGLPKNLVTQKQYRGINPLLLLSAGYSSPYWLTFRQAKQLKGNIRKGEKGCPVVFWKWIEVENNKKSEEKKQIPLLKYYTVFNLNQTENIESSKIKPTENVSLENASIEDAQNIVENMPLIKHNEARAYYRLSTDSVNMPKKVLFSSIEEYYCALFHELTHSTGHESRLNRKRLQIKFSSTLKTTQKRN